MLKNWKSVTVEQLLEIVELSEMELTPTELQIERLSIVTDTNYFDSDLDELDTVLKQYSWLDKLPTNQTSVNFKGITFGNFVDLEHYLTIDVPIKSIDKICAILNKSTTDIILKESVYMHYPTLQAYLNYRLQILEKYKGLFEDEEDETDYDEEEEQTEQQPVNDSKFAWQRLIYKLCNGDITKAKEVVELGHIMVFNWLSLENQPSAKKS